MSEENKSEEVSGSLSGNLNAPQTIEEKKRTLRIAKCLQGEPVVILNGRQSPQPQQAGYYAAVEKWAVEIFKNWGYKAISPELGEIELSMRSIKNSNAHKLNPFKAEAYRSIKDVIEQGVVFAQTQVGKEEHFFISAPVTIDNQIDLVTVLVQRNIDSQKMYLHSVMIREKILEKDFEQKNTLGYPSSVADTLKNEPEPQGKLYPRDIGRILQNYLKVNIRELEVEINQQIEQQKGNKMAQENENTAEQQISRQELNERFVEWSYEMVVTFEDYAEYNKMREQNPLMNVSDDILTDKEKELKNFHQALQGVELNPSITEKYGKLIDEIKEQSTAELSRSGWVEKTVDYPPIYSANNPYAAYAKDDEEVRQNADDWEMREPLTSEKLSHFNELAQKQGFTTYVENHHADTGVFQADKKIDETYSIEIIGQFKNHGSQDAFESARDFTMSFHQGDEIVHYFHTNQLDKALEQAAEFSKNPAQWIEDQDKTVEQHLSDLVDETVAIMQKHSVIEQNRLPENEILHWSNVNRTHIGHHYKSGAYSIVASDRYNDTWKLKIDDNELGEYADFKTAQKAAEQHYLENRLPENSSQTQTPFDKKVREYVQLKADIRENETQQAEIWGAKDFVDEMKSLQEKHDELMTQKTQIEKEYPTIWQAAERFEQQQMAEMAKDANLSGNLKDKVKEVHQELAVESLDFQFTHKGLADRTTAFNQELLQLNPEQLKELQPYFEQHKAIQTLQDLYKQTGDTARLDEINEHNRLIEWKIHNKVEAYLGKHIDYSDMDYYKGIKTGEELQQMMNDGQRLPETESVSGNPEPITETQSQPQVDEPKNFVQNQENINQTPQNSIEKSTSSIKNEKIPTRDLTGDISSPEIFQEKVMFAKVEETQITQMIDEIAKSRTYLAVDFDNKDAAKAAGAKYDPQAKGWFAEEITPELRQFLPQQPENITAERKALSDFQRQAETIGLDMANFKEVFGSWQRVPIKGKGKTNADGGYKLYRNDDGSIGACAKNYSTGDSVAWNDRLKDGKQIQSKVPLPDYLANQKQKEWNTVAQHTAQSNVAAMRGEVAANAYHQLQPALATDPYIQNKGISDIGKLKRLNDGSTIVPLYHNGKIANLQMIRPNGEKRLMSQAAKVGAYYSIGNTKTPQAVIVAEGVATADSVHQIASEIYGKDKVLVLAAIDSGNLHNVAAKVEQAFPQTEKLIAADNDAHNATRSELKFKNAGLDKANEVKEAYPNFQVALCPALNDEKGQVKNTDWNDFLKAHGKTEAVKAFAQNDKYITQQKATTLPETENSRNQDKGGKERSL